MFKILFSNVGGKLKLFATINFYLIWIGGMIAGFVLLASLPDEGRLYGAFIMLLSVLPAWLSSLPLYAVGQLIQNTDLLVQKNENLVKNTEVLVQITDTLAQITNVLAQNTNAIENKMGQVRSLEGRVAPIMTDSDRIEEVQSFEGAFLKRCSKCGSWIKAEACFCAKCGSKME